GIRFVRCAACGMVYVNPASDAAGVNSLDIEKVRPFDNEGDRALALRDFARLLERVAADHQRINGKPLERTLLLGKLVEALPASTLLVVTYTNTDSLPARMMRRHWPPFFEHKTCFFSTGNLATLMARFGRVLKVQYALPVTHTAQYVGERLAPASAI